MRFERLLRGGLAFGVGLGLLVAAPALAGAAPLTLQGAITYALANAPSIKAQQAALAAARQTLAQQRSQAYPTVSGMLQSFLAKSSNYGGGYAVIGATQQSIVSQNTAQVGTQYTLTTGGASLIQLAADAAQAKAAQATLKRTRDQIATQVTAAFFSIANHQALVALNRSDLHYERVLVLNAQAKERAGVAAGVDVLRARVAERKSQSTLVGSIASVRNAHDELAQLIGAPFSTVFAVPTRIAQPPLPKVPLANLVQMALANRPDVASARDALLAANLNRKAFGRNLFPSVQLSAGIGNQFSPTQAVFQQQFIDQQFAANNAALIAAGQPPLPLSAKPIVPRGSPGFWQIQAVSTFQLPLVDWGARKGQAVAFNAQIVSAHATYRSVRGQAELDVRRSYRAATTALAQLGFAREESRLGGEAARIAQLQYQNGLIALSDVLLAQQTSHQAHVDLINARTAYVNAVVQLRVALGTYGPRSAVADLTGRGKTSAAISNQPVPPKTSSLFGHNATALLPHHSSFRRNIRARSGHRGFSRNLLEGTP